MSMNAGEFVSILGPSGCGKSTLLNVLAGLQKASSGQASLFGKPVDGQPHRNIGIVFQQARLLPWLTVLENIFIPIDAMRLKRADYLDRAHALLKLVGLPKFAKHYPDELSGGMQQRVGLARSMIHDPKLILMDEPFAALDAMTRERMSVELQEILGKSKQSVLFITHSIPEAVFLSDRVLMMSSSPGRFIEEVHVPLKRPRALDAMASGEFAELCGRLRKLYKH
nr:ABC transporter ATP-binding protein [Peristeroidobacter soli]